MNLQDPITIANQWLRSGAVFLDTETTGMGPEDEVCEVAIVDVDGVVLVNTLIRPRVPIQANAKRVHGIDSEMVETAPALAEVWDTVRRVTHGRPVVIYDAAFDTRMFVQSLLGVEMSDGTADDMNIGAARCAMNLYAEFSGAWDSYRESWKWHKLGNACAQMHIPISGMHRAAADADACRRLVLAMAQAGRMVEAQL